MIVRVSTTVNSAIFIGGMLLVYSAGSIGEKRGVEMDSLDASIKNCGSQFFHHNLPFLNGLNEDGVEEHELRKLYDDIVALARHEEVTHMGSSLFAGSSFNGVSAFTKLRHQTLAPSQPSKSKGTVLQDQDVAVDVLAAPADRSSPSTMKSALGSTSPPNRT